MTDRQQTQDKSQKDNLAEELNKEASGRGGGIFSEFVQYLLNNKKWWLTPIIVVLLLISALVILASSGAAPFIYTLF